MNKHKKNMFTKLIAVFGLSFLSLGMSAQVSHSDSAKILTETVIKKSILKVNLTSLAFKSFSFQYEKMINKNTTVAANIHVMPYGDLAFKQTISDIASKSYIDFNNFKVGNSGATFELRYYLGKKGAFNGFYIGPTLSYDQYTFNLPISYTEVHSETPSTIEIALFNGKSTAFTWGVQMGSQFKLSKSLYLDWWIAGMSFGKSNGALTNTGIYTASDQKSLGDQLSELKSDIPFSAIKSYTVYEEGNGARINLNGSWTGIRAMGINIGYRF